VKVWVLNGPNLNLLGNREPKIYGSGTLEELNEEIVNRGRQLGLAVQCYQSNHEGWLVDKIHAAAGEADCLIINPAAYSHYSIAIRDAVAAIAVPVIEVHLSNIAAREEFRHRSLITPVAAGQISGFGKRSYILALEAAKLMLIGS